jgi:tricarballylate dehydrogenase
MNAYYQTAAKLGIEIAYESQVVELNIRGDEFLSARLNNGSLEIVAKALVVASGGFEANIPWLREYWGEAADNFIIRGTRHNQGQLLKQSSSAAASRWAIHAAATRSRSMRGRPSSTAGSLPV